MANKFFTVEFICYQVSSRSLNHFFSIFEYNFYLKCLNFLGLDGLVDDGPEPLLILLPAAHHAVQDPAHVPLTLCSRGSPEMDITKNKNP